MTPYLATDTRFTIVPGSPAAILAWFTTHKPAGSTNALSGSTGGPGALALEQAFQWPATAVLDQRDMLLSAETFGQGRSLVRIDTGVVYTPNRPAAERVPAGVDRVVLTVTPPGGQAVTGELVYLDDFDATLRDSSGQLHTFRRGPSVKVVKTDPLEAHHLLLDRISDKNIHDLVVYLETVK